jgi:UDP-N-acetyl-2-amino-2-deoxyglucuronate dehydrogenase
MSTKKINAAIIGCGNISSSHANAIVANKEQVNLYAFCDNVESKAQDMAQLYEVKKYFTDYKAMLQDPAIDLVCICTPSGMHAEMAIDCAYAGKHVLCEKPLDIKREKIDHMIDAFRRTGLKLGSVFQYRTYPGLMKAKEILDNGELGAILVANGYCKIYRGPEYYQSADWRGTLAMDGGGCLMNQAIHTLDILCWLAGGVESVKAEVYTLARDIEVEDTAFAKIKFRNNAHGFFHATVLANPGIGVKVEILCEKGRIEFTDPDTMLYRTDAKNNTVKTCLDATFRENVNTANDPKSLPNYGHCFLIADMADAIAHDRNPYIPGDIGRYAVDVILSIYESSRENKAIEIR